MRLNREQIAAVLPHRGRMCLIDEVQAYDADSLHGRSHAATQRANPMADADGRLGAACAVEYAAQAMALHHACRAMAAASSGQVPRLPRGTLAGVRDLQLFVSRLDDLDADLDIRVTLLSGDAGAAQYALQIDAGARAVARGRAMVVIDAGAAEARAGEGRA
ncbi:MAG: 3-hydroxylacyl-ACP dehydratase [Burkholderiaceae bacterium]